MKAYISLLLAIAAPAFAEELQARGGGGDEGGWGGGGKPTTTWGGGGGGYSTTTDVVYTTSMYTFFILHPLPVMQPACFHLLVFGRSPLSCF